MKIVLTANGVYAASRLKDRIIRSVRGDEEDIRIETWSYLKSTDGYDVVFHNPSQYVDDPSKNVVFKVELDGENIVFSCAYWTRNPEPDRNMYCLHIGRLTEMLLNCFSKEISRFIVSGF